MWRQMPKLRIKDTTLSTMYVPWDKSKIAASDLQDGEQSKTLDNGVEDTIRAIYTCMDFADFDSVKFITSKEVIDIRGEDLLQDGIVCEEPSISITNMKDYARFMIYHLTEHVDTNYTLTIQHDGFIVNPDQWRDEYYDYDQGELRCIPVEGWLIRINGVKFPRPDVWDDGRLDWTYRYTPKDTAEGKMIAVEKAVSEYEKN